MSDRPVLAPRLRELDDTLADRGMPRHVRERVGARLRQEALRREATSGFRFRWLPALTFAAGAALVLMVVGVRLSGPSPSLPQAARLAPSVFGGVFTVQGEDCRHHEQTPEVELDGACLLSAPHMVVHTWDRVRLRDEGHHEAHDEAHARAHELRLLEGTAMFDVTKVAAGAAPTRIPVSHGVIEVLGTRFTIEQGPHGGHVDLFEGKIRFIDLEGVATEIAPGQRHTWGDAVAVLSPPPPPLEGVDAMGHRAGPLPTSDDDATNANDMTDADGGELGAAEDDASDGRSSDGITPSKRRTRRAEPRKTDNGDDTTATATATAEDATAIIDEVTRLRAQGRYVEAASVLRRADRERRWDARTAQVLSYELGEIIERHLDDRNAACEHWARHSERWPSGRYARAVKAAHARLSCPTPSSSPPTPPSHR